MRIVVDAIQILFADCGAYPQPVVLINADKAVGRGFELDVHKSTAETSPDSPYGSGGTLGISTVHTFASNWLAPRIGSFQLRHPNIAVRLDTSSYLVDFSQLCQLASGRW